MEEDGSLLTVFSLLCSQRKRSSLLPAPWPFQALQSFFSAHVHGVCIRNWQCFCCQNSAIYITSPLKTMWVICSHFIDSHLWANAARTNIILSAVQDWTATLFTISIMFKLGGINYYTLGLFVQPSGWQLNSKTLAQWWGKFFCSMSLVPGLLPSLHFAHKHYLATEYLIRTWRTHTHTDQAGFLCQQHQIQFRFSFCMCIEESGSFSANQYSTLLRHQPVERQREVFLTPCWGRLLLFPLLFRGRKLGTKH